MKYLVTFLPLLVLSSAGDEDKVTLANNRFCFELLQSLEGFTETNILFSPYSVSTAMGMIYVGARGETQRELFQGLGYSASGLTHEQVLSAYGPHTSRLQSPHSNATFKVANAVAIDERLALEESYENTLTTSFKADLHKVEFLHGPQATLNLINDWVKEKTDGMIMRLFDGQLDRSLRLMLLNAIYFKGSWNRPFDKTLTEKRQFFKFGGGLRTEVDTMVGRFEVGYHMSDQLRVAVADLPYVGHDFSMTVLLPLEKYGVEQLRRNLTLDLFQSLVSELRGREVDVFLPKFKLDTKYVINEPLIRLGIRKIFGGGTDLSGINGDTDLVVNVVLQKTVVEVNEEGSEAAGATGAGLMPLSAAVSPPPAFRVDHPFLFFIRNTRTKDILFAGQVNKL
ncbi:intracellular coagulation inhibitor 3 [Ixodes scapularis]|uniref:intracellular coagulation inhibitor 3 n=1 Tax=Ixodes scapularis TaxID=6945 RepID=UPI001C389A28|nr:intracellular coagulation inhibitor 3 [Ixodes scapularis]